MSRPNNYFTTLAGIPVHYDRAPLAPYGSRGVPYKFYATRQFQRKLDVCFEELWSVCPDGRGELLVSAGAYTEKPRSYHRTGEAFDLDGIFWANKTFICLNYPSDPVFYLGVEAVLRKHFPTVLSYLYNKDHHDHLHMDVGGQIGFGRQYNAKVLFLQASITHVLRYPIRIDGDFGSETERGVRKAFELLNISGSLDNLETWMLLLTRLSETAFGASRQGLKINTPLSLLHDIYNIVGYELEGNPARKNIESALSAFASHEDTQNWLDRFNEGENELEREAGLDLEDDNVSPKQVRVRRVVERRKAKWYATIDAGPEFLAGEELSFRGGMKGLGNYASGPKYKPDDYKSKYGYWADFIYPTALCESQSMFHCLNTYDRAYFTLGFLQFAAHVYDGDFIKFFRALLATPQSREYFPDLQLKDGRIHRVTESGLKNLETRPTRARPSLLMTYLNPTIQAVEQVEVEQAARFVHWAMNSQEHRDIQVEVGINLFKSNMRVYARSFGLNNMLDKVCLVVADIRHQGRGGETSVQQIRSALSSSGGDAEVAYKNLLKIGAADYASRITTLRNAVNTMIRDGKLGRMKYSTARNDFVPL